MKIFSSLRSYCFLGIRLREESVVAMKGPPVATVYCFMAFAELH